MVTGEAIFRGLIEAAPDAMIVVNGAGTIVLVNAQAERLFGYNREELLGQAIEILVPTRYAGAHAAHRAKYVGGAHPRPMGMGLELFGRRKDGSEFPVEISLSPIRTEGEMLVASAIRDISERKAADDERARLLRERAAHAEANRIKDEFLATLSHELRTPLNAVLGWVGLIETGKLSAEELTRALGAIARNARAQAQLVEDLLDVSRILSGKIRVQPVALDLSEVADAAVEAVKPSADAKQIHLESHYEVRPLLLIGDADRLQQVIWNLLSNAVKFTPEHGRIELRLAQSDVGATVVIRDTGMGIAPSFLPHVFDRFRQADSSSTRPQGGLGLGLAIAKSIVELHGGTIEVASSGEGQGATFRVTLPAGVTGERRRRRSARAEADALREARILIVDDQEDERALLAAIFHHDGAEVRDAASVSEAMRIMGEWRPQLIVSDLAMPGEDGYSFVRRVRSTEDLANVPAIAVTAHARTEDRDAAFAAGFTRYVSKPIDRDLLLSDAAELVKVSQHVRRR